MLLLLYRSVASKIICPPYIHLSDSYLQDESNKAAQDLLSTITVTESFLSESEEKSILDEIEPYLKRLHYEFDHWDDVSFGGVLFALIYSLFFVGYSRL